MSGLTREQKRMIIDAAVEQSTRRFGELMAAGAFDGLDPTNPEDRAKIDRMMGLERPTHEDIERWVLDGWFDALEEG